MGSIPGVVSKKKALHGMPPPRHYDCDMDNEGNVQTADLRLLWNSVDDTTSF